jgi:hypothetical protein
VSNPELSLSETDSPLGVPEFGPQCPEQVKWVPEIGSSACRDVFALPVPLPDPQGSGRAQFLYGGTSSKLEGEQTTLNDPFYKLGWKEFLSF